MNKGKRNKLRFTETGPKRLDFGKSENILDVSHESKKTNIHGVSLFFVEFH